MKHDDDVAFGAGRAGLVAAIRLEQLNADAALVVIEKGSEPGAHILSGAVMDPLAITEPIPDWQALGAPLAQPVTGDDVLFLSDTRATRTSGWLVARNLHTDACCVISLGVVMRWLGPQAEALWVEIFPGLAASDVLYDERGAMRGVATGNLGLSGDGELGHSFRLGMELVGEYIVFAEGARGHLGKQLVARLRLDEGCDPRRFVIGIKALWKIVPERSRPGLVMHTAGWRVTDCTFGGGFIYHLGGNKVSLGFVVGRDCRNPYLIPFQALQRWKTLPAVRGHLAGSKRVDYGTRDQRRHPAGGAQDGVPWRRAGWLRRVLPEGRAYQGQPRGDQERHAVRRGHCPGARRQPPERRAGRLPRSLCREPAERGAAAGVQLQALVQEVQVSRQPDEGCLAIAAAQARRRQPAVDTACHRPRPRRLAPRGPSDPDAYPKPDVRISFDRLSSVFISNANHEENPPAHVTLKDAAVPLTIKLVRFAGPEGRYCPAGVCEFLSDDDGADRLVINAQNCVQFKTCDIKESTQNIVWVTPEGGGRPNYADM